MEGGGVGYEYCQDVRGWNEGTEIQSCNAINDLKVVHTVVFCCCFVVFFLFFFLIDILQPSSGHSLEQAADQLQDV